MSDKSGGGRRPRRKFTQEFKDEAVRLVDEAGGNVTKVARELNLNPSTLRNWVERKRAEEAGAPTAEERAEIRELRRELERVTRERDILGKAVAYFSARDPKNG
jgi:transposase